MIPTNRGPTGPQLPSSKEAAPADAGVRPIISRALQGERLDSRDCLRLMACPDGSPDADLVISAAGSMARRLNGGACSIGVQIGVATGPCSADCGFCSFAMGTSEADDYVMPPDVLRRYVRELTANGAVSSISLITIHDTPVDVLLDAVAVAGDAAPVGVDICVNTGDLLPSEAAELRDAGVSRAYHAIRVGEGDDTRLNPSDRLSTIRTMARAGLEVVSCVEPIGPEHSPEEIVRLFRAAREAGCSRCSAARRLDVPGTRLHGAGEISPARLELIRSALLLSTGGDGFYGGHYGGMGMDFAEYAGSPKDNEWYSELGNGNTLAAALGRMRSAGYTVVRGAGGRLLPIDPLLG